MARKRQSRCKGQLPKGAYRLPTDGYVTSSVYRSPTGKNLVIHGVVRDDPDLHKIARALIELATKQTLEQQREDEDVAAA